MFKKIFQRKICKRFFTSPTNNQSLTTVTQASTSSLLSSPASFSFPSLHSPSDVNALLSLMYGETFLSSLRVPCVSHVTSTLLLNDNYYTLRINSQSPSSLFDKFILSVSRARCDLIVLTGAILRAEPNLTANLFIAENVLKEWRKSLGIKTNESDICILTNNINNIDPNHPIFTSSNNIDEMNNEQQSSKVFIYTGLDSSSNFNINNDNNNKIDPTVIRVAKPSLSSLIQDFRSTHSIISAECGPSTTSSIYQSMMSGNNDKNGLQLVDEILLSTYNNNNSRNEIGMNLSNLSDLCVPSSWTLSETFLDFNFCRQSSWKTDKWKFERFTKR